MRALAAVLAIAVLASPRPARATESELPELVKKTSPAVVFIRARGEGSRMWTASGFVVNDTKLIVTAYHVVEGAKSVEITLSSKERVKALRVFSHNRSADLAVLEVEGELPDGLDVAKATAVETGEDIVVIGNPIGLANTVSRGIVSAVREDEGVQWIQISASISPGSSGGPILTIDGTVVGIVSYTYSGRRAQNLNFGVSTAHLAPLLENEDPLEIGAIERHVEQGDRALARQNAEQGWFQLLRRDDRWKAEELFQVALQYDETQGEAIAGCYFCRSLQGTYPPNIEEILEDADVPYEACLVMAEICERLRKHALASRYYDRARELDPKRPEVYLVAAFNHSLAGNAKKAHELAAKAVELDSNLEPQALYYEAYAHQQMTHPEKAVPLYERCCELDPEHDRARAELANCYMGMKHYAEAREAAELVLKRSPHLPSSRVTLAVCYGLLSGDLPKAKALLDEEVEMFPRREADVAAVWKRLAAMAPTFEITSATHRGVEHKDENGIWYEYRLMVRVKNLSNHRRGGTLQIEYYNKDGELLLVNTLTIPEIESSSSRLLTDSVKEQDTVRQIENYFITAD